MSIAVILQRSGFWLLALVLVLLPGCSGAPAQRHLDISQGGVNLHIPDREWDPHDADFDAGWCGETCIQMAASYYGLELKQARIHEAGRPQTSDLEERDMDNAMSALGLSFQRFEGDDFSEFTAWIRDNLRHGWPVICGTKIYPCDHPRWDIDHFVVASGYNSKGLLLNTQLNLDGQLVVTDEQLASQHEGYSFINRQGTFWGRAITGIQK